MEQEITKVNLDLNLNQYGTWFFVQRKEGRMGFFFQTYKWQVKRRVEVDVVTKGQIKRLNAILSTETYVYFRFLFNFGFPNSLTNFQKFIKNP